MTLVLPSIWRSGRCTVLAPATGEEAYRVLCNLRLPDLIELLATCPDDAPDLVAAALRIPQQAVSCVFCSNDEPAAVMFLSPSWPGVWQGGMLGTPAFASIAVQATRYCVDVWGRAFVERGLGHRIQMLAHACNDASVRWMTRCLGGRIEGRLRSFGRGREPFVMVGWEIEDVQLRSGRGGRRASVGCGGGLHRHP